MIFSTLIPIYVVILDVKRFIACDNINEMFHIEEKTIHVGTFSETISSCAKK